MEQQAANLYTKKAFEKFQEELVDTFVHTANKIDGHGTLNKYWVAKYEHDHKAYIVMLDVSEMNASYSCQMFEYAGKRWIRNARAGLSDVQNTEVQSMECLRARFNNLGRAALIFAKEEAIATETYNAFIDVLREGARKIAVVKKTIAKIKAPNTQGSGGVYDIGSRNVTLPVPDMIPSLLPCQDVEPNRFNLNDSNIC
ncbi:hypothetical protein CASFOL_011731 [Castilleja foliolosa]|uniref:Protein FAR1-RELATED SEQUENCE n=1 Tax=Castilleja foliolosa TaxID=1961234 RepID=A0ABD3DQ46_9LAMI